jgi:hypothetical protein
MKVNIALHDMDVLRLREAILIYEGGGSSRTFATLHEIEQNTGKRSAPFLTAGRALQWEELRELHDRLYTPIQADFLPPKANGAGLRIFQSSGYLLLPIFSGNKYPAIKPHPELISVFEMGCDRLHHFSLRVGVAQKDVEPSFGITLRTGPRLLAPPTR